MSELKKKISKLRARINRHKVLNFIVFLPCMFLSYFCIDFLLRYFTRGIGFYSVREFTPNLFSVCWIVLIMNVVLLFPEKLSKIMYGVSAIVFMIAGAAHYIYYQVFQKFFWLDDIKVAKEGLDYRDVIFQNMRGGFWAIIFVTLLFICLTLFFYPKFKKKLWHDYPRMASAAVTGVVAVFGLTQLPDTLGQPNLQDWNSFRDVRYIYDKFYDQNKVMQLAGFYDYTLRDFYVSFIENNSKSAKESVTEVDRFYAEKEEPVANEMTGVFADKNVIMVMLETGDDWMITEEYTPALYYMMEHGINFTNHFAPIWGAGATFNTEFTSIGGFYSLTKGNAAYAFAKNHFPYSLPNQMKQLGYSARSYHMNHASFYNRDMMHESLGFDEHIGFKDHGLGEYEGEFDSAFAETDFYQGMFEDAPFFDFYITYSAHLPYVATEDSICLANLDQFPELWESDYPEEYRCANIQINETDRFFQSLMSDLADKNLLEDTIIVVYADHYAYGYNEKEELMEWKSAVDDSGILEHVPFFIYHYGSEPMKIDKVTNSSDILPTVLNLVGKVPSKYYLGNDVFDPAYHGYVYFSDFTWYDGELYYQGEESDDPYVQQMNYDVVQIKDINDKVLEYDYFKNK